MQLTSLVTLGPIELTWAWFYAAAQGGKKAIVTIKKIILATPSVESNAEMSASIDKNLLCQLIGLRLVMIAMHTLSVGQK